MGGKCLTAVKRKKTNERVAKAQVGEIKFFFFISVLYYSLSSATWVYTLFLLVFGRGFSSFSTQSGKKKRC